MRFVLCVLLCVTVVGGCDQHVNADETAAKLAELRAQTSAMQAETERIKVQAAAAQVESERLKAEVETVKAEKEAVEARNARLQEKVEKKPSLPITVSFRKAVLGPGNVAVINTTVKENVSILVTLNSAALGTTKSFELHVDPCCTTLLGHLEGAVIESGDEIVIENRNYSPARFLVSF